MKYKWDVKTSVSINEPSKELSFSFKSFKELLVFDLSRIITHSAGNIRKCENCGNYFFSTVRSDEIYCKYPFGNNTCKATGYLNKLKNDDIMSTYRRIYKTQNARKHRNKDKVLNIEEKFSKWEKAALKKRAECKTGKCSLEEMVKSISGSSWLKE